MIVIVLIFVGAFIGPTLRCGASGFFWMNEVWLARPLYVPSACASFDIVLADPKRFFADNAPVESSSYQLVCLVASLALAIGAFLSAV